MKLAGRIPVEPLDDERLTRIERRIVAGAGEATARPLASRRPLGWAVAGVAALAALALAWRLHTVGDHGDRPAAPIALATDARGAHLDLGDATVALGPDAAVDVTRPDGGVLVRLDRGRIELEVAKRHGRPPLVVRAGDTDVIVVGTHFTVDRGDGHGEVVVTVTEGVVRVVRRGVDARVAAGEAWHGARGVVARIDGPATTIRPPTATDPAVPGDPAHPGAASGAVAIALGEAPTVLHGRTAAVPTTPTSPATHAHVAVEVPGPRSAPTPSPHDRRGPADPLVELTAAIARHPLAPALDVHAGDPASTVAAYQRMLASAKGEDAGAVLYGLALVSHLRLGRDADALRSLDAYVRRFTAGAELPAVLWLRIRILCRRSLDDTCRAAAHTYLERTPDGDAAHLAERITLTTD